MVTGPEDSRVRSIVIVEDDAAMRSVWRVVFGSRGWEVAVAATAAEGLARLDPPPDYLILDPALPDRAGMVVLRQVRDARLKTRVAVTTAAENLAEVRALAPEAVFAKPVNVADVRRDGLSVLCC